MGRAKHPVKSSETRIRCAIYTRKSTEDGLDQEFNSLDAQREAAEAYIASQKHEGWVCLPTLYDDGGFSGGNVERPGLQRMLADIRDGKIDCVVVYKVDRLSRSLMDFARVMETFEKHNVWFVSVTQQFNTTHSMGRLTLNILLSFAQFEREIIGERIRDKLAAQRRKGKWAGGIPVLGYDLDRSNPSPKLVVNVKEASQVRKIFEWYLELGSLLPVVQRLAEKGMSNKRWTTKRDVPRGGKPFDKNALYSLLTNPIYTGLVVHNGERFAGEHPLSPVSKHFSTPGLFFALTLSNWKSFALHRFRATTCDRARLRSVQTCNLNRLTSIHIFSKCPQIAFSNEFTHFQKSQVFRESSLLRRLRLPFGSSNHVSLKTANPNGQRRSGADQQAAPVGHETVDAIHCLYWAMFISF